jgi:hypothetical protein
MYTFIIDINTLGHKIPSLMKMELSEYGLYYYNLDISIDGK